MHARVAGARVADGIEVRLEGGSGAVFEDGAQTDWLDVLPITVPRYADTAFRPLSVVPGRP